MYKVIAVPVTNVICCTQAPIIAVIFSMIQIYKYSLKEQTLDTMTRKLYYQLIGHVMIDLSTRRIPAIALSLGRDYMYEKLGAYFVTQILLEY